MASVDIVGGLVQNTRPDTLITSTPSGKNWVMSGNGVLSCALHDGMIWDECIRDVIMDMQDSDSIWYGFVKRDIQQILVPVLPNEYKIFGLVGLKEISKNILSALLIPTSDYGKNSSTQWVNLGVISRGDGRAVLRQMIIGQFAAIMDGEPKCESFRHNWRRRAFVEQEVKKDKSIALACAWCSFWYEKCYYCYLDDMNAPDTGSKFDADLIPKH